MKTCHELDNREAAKNMLADDRFGAMFTDENFQVDENDLTYKLLNPVLSKLDNKKVSFGDFFSTYRNYECLKMQVCLDLKLYNRSVLTKLDNKRVQFKVSVQGVESLWVDCRFIPADWGSQ